MRLIVSVLGLAAIISAQGYGTPAAINTGSAPTPYGSPYGIQPSYQQQQFFVPSSGPAHDSKPDFFNQLFQQQNQQSQQNQQNSIVSPPHQTEQPRQQFNQPLINQQPLISTVANHQQPNQVQQQPQQTSSSYYGVPSGPFQTGFAGYPTYPTGYGTVQTMNNPYIMYAQQPFEWGRGTVITSQLTQSNTPTTTHAQNEQNRPRNEIAAVGYGAVSSSIQPASQAYGTPYYGTQYQQQMLFGPSARATGNMERTAPETATSTSTTTASPVTVTSRPVSSGVHDRSPVQETSGPAGNAPQEVDPWASISSTVNGVAKKASEVQGSKKDH